MVLGVLEEFRDGLEACLARVAVRAVLLLLTESGKPRELDRRRHSFEGVLFGQRNGRERPTCPSWPADGARARLAVLPFWHGTREPHHCAQAQRQYAHALHKDLEREARELDDATSTKVLSRCFREKQRLTQRKLHTPWHIHEPRSACHAGCKAASGVRTIARLHPQRSGPRFRETASTRGNGAHVATRWDSRSRFRAAVANTKVDRASASVAAGH